MTSVHLIAVGRLKAGPFRDIFDSYKKRMKWPIHINEIDIRASGNQQNIIENKEIESLIQPDSRVVFVLDERGKNMTSIAFSEIIKNYFDQGKSDFQFIIGGADGLSSEIRSRAHHILSFGALTWPHMMARLMWIEQLYRAQQILSGHPYHRGD